ncbi:hypothetical protein L873DRAFT_679581 [Choiromyces venosus 120613-1]|uniref:Uncharacterized protein n=1 Tax=Choiromyces venosus 120613-1 TaxID=1336337 RepID=A0A3N4JT56_9PEZI|nr:hypothetical protein L873DRAFT_679581 [Choiromyces venosus 120613-1]
MSFGEDFLSRIMCVLVLAWSALCSIFDFDSIRWLESLLYSAVQHIKSFQDMITVPARRSIVITPPLRQFYATLVWHISIGDNNHNSSVRHNSQRWDKNDCYKRHHKHPISPLSSHFLLLLGLLAVIWWTYGMDGLRYGTPIH